jgi:hypothetical protein
MRSQRAFAVGDRRRRHGREDREHTDIADPHREEDDMPWQHVEKHDE